MSLLEKEHTRHSSEEFPRSRLEVVLAILILLESTRALQYWYPSVGLVADSRLTNLGRMIWPTLAMLSSFAMLRRPWLVRRHPDVLVTATLVLIALSFIWSVDTSKTLFQSIILVSTLICGTYLVTVFSKAEFIDLAANTLGVVCAVSIGAAAAGVSLHLGQTTGFFEHKNIFGLAAACGTLLALARIGGRRRSPDVWISGALCSVALFLSGARSSQFAVVLVMLVLGFLAIRRTSQLAAFVVTAPAIALYVVGIRAAGGLAAIFSASGKSSDLTGRTDIWASVVELIDERPVLGWGYLAYWRDEGFPGGRKSGFEEFGLRSAHNGYLEAALGAGILAAVLLAITLFVLIRRGYRQSASGVPSSAGIALFAIAAFAAAVGFSEAFFPSTGRPLLTVLVVALSAGPRMWQR